MATARPCLDRNHPRLTELALPEDYSEPLAATRNAATDSGADGDSKPLMTTTIEPPTDKTAAPERLRRNYFRSPAATPSPHLRYV